MPKRGILKKSKRGSTYIKGNKRYTRYTGKRVRFKPGTKRYTKKELAFKKFRFEKRNKKNVKDDAKYKRRQKKINKVVSRVLADMNDDVATMYRQSVDKYAHVWLDGVAKPLDGVASEQINNGNYVSLKTPEIKALVKRNECDFFQIDKFHGMIAPSWKRGTTDQIPSNVWGYDGDTSAWTDNQLIGTGPEATTSTLPWADGQNENAKSTSIDIRAFAEIEIPFLPCIPANIDNKIINYGSTAVPRYSNHHEFDQFCRTNNKIKIKNNYMRFRFFATKNGQVVKRTVPIPFDGGGNSYDKVCMDGTYSNIEPVFTMPTNGNYLSANLNYNGYTVLEQYGNRPKEYKIAAKRFAKVRILLYERDQEEEHPIELSQFMRYGEHNLDANNVAESGTMPGGNLMVSEEYRLQKRFHSPRLTKMDYLYEADTAEQERLNAGKLIIDKVINLPMGKETVFTCNPLAGTILEYDDSEPATMTDSGTVIELQKDNDETATSPHKLPISVNEEPLLYTPNADSELHDGAQAMKAEYKPKNKQYAMFMLMYCQRAGIEYDIFQKFVYDK